MIIHQGFRDAVCFLCVPEKQDDGSLRNRPVATAFVVSVPLDPDAFFTVYNFGDAPSTPHALYVVTANHVITETRPGGGPLYLRVNTDTGTRDIPIRDDAWKDNHESDVAAARLSGDISISWVPSFALATEKEAYENAFQYMGGYQEGDDVFFVGLFSQHYGQHRNQPVIRFGTISLMPHEDVLVTVNKHLNTTKDIEAYLVEARSWGGQSGSPAFIFFRVDRDGPAVLAMNSTRAVRLLGLVQGHYDIDSKVTLSPAEEAAGSVPINAGMAVVIPAQKIIDLLMDEDFVNERDRLLKDEKQSRPAATSDSDYQAPDTDAPWSKDVFLRDLRKVTRRVAPESEQAEDGK